MQKKLSKYLKYFFYYFNTVYILTHDFDKVYHEERWCLFNDSKTIFFHEEYIKYLKYRLMYNNILKSVLYEYTPFIILCSFFSSYFFIPIFIILQVTFFARDDYNLFVMMLYCLIFLHNNTKQKQILIVYMIINFSTIVFCVLNRLIINKIYWEYFGSFMSFLMFFTVFYNISRNFNSFHKDFLNFVLFSIYSICLLPQSIKNKSEKINLHIKNDYSLYHML